MFSKVGIGLLVASVLFGTPANAAGRFGQRAQATTPAPSATVYPAPMVYENSAPTAPPSYAPQYQEQPQAVTAVQDSAPGRVMVGLEGHIFSQGANLGATASVEDSHWGFIAQGYLWGLGALDGIGGTDTMQTASARLTYALLSGTNGRFRLEAGADVVNTHDVMMVGPSVGASALLKLSIVSLEASANWTPVPFQQLDVRAGAGVSLGIVTLRGGWRTQFLSDSGVMDGLEQAESFSGPYAGIALVF
jgi:hypothetical protein